MRPAREAGLCGSWVLLGAGGQKGAEVMFEALSTSRWKWTWRFLLLACVSVVVFALAAFISSQSSTGEVGVLFFLGLLCVAGLAVGVIGAVVSFVATILRRHGPPAKPVA